MDDVIGNCVFFLVVEHAMEIYPRLPSYVLLPAFAPGIKALKWTASQLGQSFGKRLVAIAGRYS
jgi:hypothetical protein